MTEVTAGHRTLVAGVGNVFLSDDGFGVEVVRQLRAEPLPPDVEVVDFGVRGVHLAYQLLDGYRTLLLVDATARGGVPGTVYLIEAGGPAGPVEPGAEALLDGHRMGPDAVLGLLGTLSAGTGGRPPERVLVVGCEPQSLDEGLGLSPPVAAAVSQAVALVRRLLREPDQDGRARSGEPPAPSASRTERTERAERAERKASSC